MELSSYEVGAWWYMISNKTTEWHDVGLIPIGDIFSRAMFKSR